MMARRARRFEVAGIAAIVFGLSMVVYFVLFFVVVAANPVKVSGDPAQSPERFADFLIWQAKTPFSLIYLELALAAAFSFAVPMAVVGRLRATTPSLAQTTAAFGYAAIALWMLLSLISFRLNAAGGSSLTRDELRQAIPFLFALIFPGLLGTFDLLAGVWILAISVAAIRSGSLSRWLAYFGVLSGVVLIAGMIGQAGTEVVVAPWLIWLGIYLLARPADAERGPAAPTRGPAS
jgi:hypothetical protein